MVKWLQELKDRALNNYRRACTEYIKNPCERTEMIKETYKEQLVNISNALINEIEIEMLKNGFEIK